MASLRWLLERPEFGLRMVVGDATDEPLTWAHAIDALDPTQWLAGGELVLTTGLRLPRSLREQRAYVERLAAAGIAGLGFGVGVRYDEIPPSIVDECARHGLPLLEVPVGTAFIAVTQAVARRLSEEQVEELQRVLSYQRDITRAAVRGGLRGAANLLARELTVEVVVLDEYGAVMAASTRRAALLDRVQEEYRRLVAAARPGTVAVDIDEGTLEMQMIQGRSGVCGWLAVVQRTPPTHTDRLLLNQAAGLMTLQLDWPAELIAAYHALGGTLLALLLDARANTSGLERHLHHFGFDPRDGVVLALATSDRRRARVEDVVAAHLEATKRPHVVARVDAGVAVLLLRRDADALVDQLVEELGSAGVPGVTWGVSGELDQFAIASGLGPAELAADAARRAGRPVGRFAELALGPVLADENVRARVWSMAAPAIEALERDAGPRDGDLLGSLEAFLHHNGSWEAASKALGVHRHTLKARMARVEEITGLPLDVAETRALLLLALMSEPFR
ncbi:PucR family transcriptional regulator ligand-binding domain-containing protein [Nocardioides panacisoli]|uniref:PucR family transcriptional regulator n=1 Tax=Nocardioides panacisoli TaxID=627624 RepID=A0ABP7J6Y1_9ACTN